MDLKDASTGITWWAWGPRSFCPYYNCFERLMLFKNSIVRKQIAAAADDVSFIGSLVFIMKTKRWLKHLTVQAHD
jgi:hypothetical protein